MHMMNIIIDLKYSGQGPFVLDRFAALIRCSLLLQMEKHGLGVN